MSEFDQLAARVQSVEEEGKQRYGDKEWGTFVSAISRANPQGVDSSIMQHILKQQNAADLIATGGREALLTLATAGDDAANRTYAEIREQERREYRLSKGRGPGWA